MKRMYIVGAVVIVAIAYFVVKSRFTNEITIISATYGANCGAAPSNVTYIVNKSCDGVNSCDYPIKESKLGDPANGCGKDFSVEYFCEASFPTKRAYLAGEANGKAVHLSCP